jgi:hypothetical protein
MTEKPLPKAAGTTSCPMMKSTICGAQAKTSSATHQYTIATPETANRPWLPVEGTASLVGRELNFPAGQNAGRRLPLRLVTPEYRSFVRRLFDQNRQA